MSSHPAPYALPLSHLLLALLVAVIWGTNFVVVKIVLETWPPLFFVFVRFLICFLPMAFFLKRPAVPWINLAAYGIPIGCGQFGLGFMAMDGHISPGLVSVVLQTQAFFTIFLAMYFDAERLRRYQWAALSLAALGIGVMAYSTWGNVGKDVAPGGRGPGSPPPSASASRSWPQCAGAWPTRSPNAADASTCWPMWSGPAPSRYRRC